MRKFTISGKEKSEFLKGGFPSKNKRRFFSQALPVSGELLVVERVPKKRKKARQKKCLFKRLKNQLLGGFLKLSSFF